MKNQRVVWLAMGPIGDALMTLSVLKEVALQNDSLIIEIIARRNSALIQELSSELEQATVIDASGKVSAVRALLKGLTTPAACVFIPPTFGYHSLYTKLFAWIWGVSPAAKVVGFEDKGRVQPYDTCLTYDFSALYIDNVRNAFKACELAPAKEGQPPVGTFLEVQPSSVYIPNLYIALHPAAANPKRSLPAARWRELVAAISAKYSVVLTGSAADTAFLKEISQDLDQVHIATGLSITETAWVLQHAIRYVGVDTGITHLAGVLGVESVVIGNNSNPTWLPTYNPKATILLESAHCTCTGDKGGNCTVKVDGQEYYRCMYEISDATILAAVLHGLPVK